MYKIGNTVYTERNIYLDNGKLAFKPYSSYIIYEAEDEGSNVAELVLINEAGMFHAFNSVNEFFNYVQ